MPQGQSHDGSPGSAKAARPLTLEGFSSTSCIRMLLHEGFGSGPTAMGKGSSTSEPQS